MVTESTQEYKGYTIRLRAVTGNGFWYIIQKQKPNASSPNGMKNMILRRMGFDYIEPDVLLQKAKNYIDEYEHVLHEKYNRLKT